MKRTIQTVIVASSWFSSPRPLPLRRRRRRAAGASPYFHLGCLIMGGLTIVSLKQRYPRLYMSEAVGSFALYAVLVAMFTAPVIEAVKTLVS